jgi:hypothetical protein
LSSDNLQPQNSSIFPACFPYVAEGFVYINNLTSEKLYGIQIAIANDILMQGIKDTAL